MRKKAGIAARKMEKANKISKLTNRVRHGLKLLLVVLELTETQILVVLKTLESMKLLLAQ